MPEEKTVISRSWGATISYLIGGFVLLSISLLLCLTIAEGPITLGIALLPAVLGIIFLFMLFGGSGVGTCPGCGAPLSGLSTKSNDGVFCTGCCRYLEGQSGLLWLTDQNRVADNPLFSSPLPEHFAFPESCCVCGQAATRREKISLTTQNASSVVTASTVGFTTNTRTSVEVPHCAEHSGGASLGGTAKSTLIRFRSYPYLRAFCQLNGTNPE